MLAYMSVHRGFQTSRVTFGAPDNWDCEAYLGSIQSNIEERIVETPICGLCILILPGAHECS